jgi:hypothetical protein
MLTNTAIFAANFCDNSDIINGKTAMMERANMMLGRQGAYSAVYSWSASKGFNLACSVTMYNGTNSVVDVPLPSTKLLETVRDQGYGSKVASTDSIMIDGTDYYVSARCANANTFIDNLSGKYTELHNQ